MAVMIKCKMCGGDLALTEGSSIATCEFCGSQQTVPAIDDDKKARLFNRANQYRMDSEFDKAYSAYESIVNDEPENAEAYWGMLLSEYGVEYVDDPKTGKKIPTCHRTLVRSVTSSPNYKSACQYADADSRIMYEDDAAVLDALQKRVLNASAKEEPYDVFICYKESDDKGERTEDSVLAHDIYDALTAKGMRVFFSRISLEDKLGQDYEPCIFAALNSAKVMLMVTTDSDHCNAVWVKNEWKRYLDFMKNDPGKTLIPVYKGISPYALPDEFTKLQAQDMGKLGAIQDLVRGVEKLAGKNQKSQLDQQAKQDIGSLKQSQKLLYFVLGCAGACVAWYAVVDYLYFIADYEFPLFRNSERIIQLVIDGNYFLPWLVGCIMLCGIVRFFTHGRKNKLSALLAALLFVGCWGSIIWAFTQGMTVEILMWCFTAAATVMALVSFTGKKK